MQNKSTQNKLLYRFSVRWPPATYARCTAALTWARMLEYTLIRPLLSTGLQRCAPGQGANLVLGPELVVHVQGGLQL